MESKADQRKQLGNQEFKKGNYQAAISHYTEALGKYTPSLRVCRTRTTRDDLLQQSRESDPAQTIQASSGRLQGSYTAQPRLFQNLQTPLQSQSRHGKYRGSGTSAQTSVGAGTERPHQQGGHELDGDSASLAKNDRQVRIRRRGHARW